MAVLLSSLVAGPAVAALYKWVDANGKVVYSDQPPPGNVQTEILKPPPPPANPNAAKDLQDQEKARQQAQKKKAEAAAADEKSRADQEQRRAACASARGQLQMLLEPGQAIVRINEKGERVQVNDTMRREEIERTQLLIRDSCKDL